MPSHQIKTYRFNHVNRINVQGPFDVTVLTGYKHQKAIIAAPTDEMAGMTVSQNNGELTIGPRFFGTPAGMQHAHLTVYANNPNTLVFDHTHSTQLITKGGDFSAIEFKQTNGIHLIAKKPTHIYYLGIAYPNDPVKIQGPFHINTLELIGNTKIKMGGSAINLNKFYQFNGSINAHLTGIKTKHLDIVALGSSRIYLKGEAHRLTARLYQRARLLGKHLYTRKAYIKAYQQSYANILVANTLFGFTCPTSRIDYFGHPEKVYQRSICASAVLPVSTGLRKL